MSDSRIRALVKEHIVKRKLAEENELREKEMT
jgi:hypothetical protein